MDITSYIENDKRVWRDLHRYAAAIKQGKALQDLTTFHTCYLIKQAIHDDDPMYAKQLFAEFDTETQIALWVAPSYAGIFTPYEREQMR